MATPKRKSAIPRCRRCQIVRSFLMAVAMLAILAVVDWQKLGVLGGVTPMHFALGMMAVGALGFAFWILYWRITRQSNDDQ